MELIFSAIILGIMGSFHCAGMCGPLALSIPLYGNNIWLKTISGIIYNLGRVVTYALMGFGFGLIGKGLSLAGFQQWVSILVGAFMVLTVLLPLVIQLPRYNVTNKAATWLRQSMSFFFKNRSLGGLFLIGFLNGLLPCGLVYLAIAGAIAAGTPLQGALFMALFGLATIPMMLFIALLGSFISLKVRGRINKVIPYVVVFVGLLFILRGLSLGIPFLSPPKEKLSPVKQMQMQQAPASEQVKGSCCHPNTEQGNGK